MITIDNFMKKYKFNPTAKNLKVVAGLDELTLFGYISANITDLEIARRCLITNRTLQHLKHKTDDKSIFHLKMYRDTAINLVVDELEQLHGTICLAEDSLDDLLSHIRKLRDNNILRTSISVDDLVLLMDCV